MSISVCAVTHKMEREWPRTLYTIQNQTRTLHQTCPADTILVQESTDPSPCKAMNWMVEKAQTEYVVCLIDGARMLSPGILEKMERVFRAYDNPFVYTISSHLGFAHQRDHEARGYDQNEEDRLLESVPWERDGYTLFSISTPVWTPFREGVSEATCFGMRRSTYLDLGGYDERFVLPGGGLANLEFFKRAQAALEPVCLLGESTFHQLHGGVSSNAAESPRLAYEAEYEAIFGEPLRRLWRRPAYLGDIRPEAEEAFE